MADSDITVSGLAAISAPALVILTWSYADPNEGGLAPLQLRAVELWAATTNNRATAIKVGEGLTAYPHFVGTATRFYWIKARNIAGLYGDWFPASATAGIQGTPLATYQTNSLIASSSATLTGAALNAPTFTNLPPLSVTVTTVFAAPAYAYSALMTGTYGRGLFAQTSGSFGDGFYGLVSAVNAIGVHGQNSSVGTDARGCGVAGSASGNVAVLGHSSANFAFYSSNGGYGPFTGAHDGLLRRSVAAEPGDVLCDVAVIARSGVSDCLTEVALSNRTGRPAIGVFVSRRALRERELFAALPERHGLVEDYDRVIINSLGEGQINVCGEGGPIDAGDLLVTSSVPGKAMRQDDDVVRACTVARAREGVVLASANDRAQIACIYLCG